MVVYLFLSSRRLVSISPRIPLNFSDFRLLTASTMRAEIDSLESFSFPRDSSKIAREEATHGKRTHATGRREALGMLLALSAMQCLEILKSSDAHGATVPPTGPRLLTPAERAAVEDAFAATLPKPKAPVCLRLVFHDAATYDKPAANGGCNASIRLELDRPENFGLKRGWNVIEACAAKLKDSVAEDLSLSDLVALAGAYAVKITGGPDIDVRVGRKDEVQEDPTGRLPSESLSAEDQLRVFGSKGLNARELVALSGAHTLGSKGFGDPLTFDNAYYTALLRKPWADGQNMGSMIGLPSDHVLADDPTCRPIIEAYAADEEKFFEDFSRAYIKLTEMGAIWT